MDMPFDALISNEMEIENEDLFGTGPFESFTTAESLEVCRLLGLSGADGVDVNTMPESSNSSSRKKITSEAAAAATHNRVVSERKRREQLSERFIALGSLIPGLKKMDKASIMEDTMKHTEELNEQIKSLELELECYLKNESDHGVEHETNSSTTTHAKVVVVLHEHMEMMVRELSNKNILIRIYYCEADGKCVISIASKLLSYLQTIQLTVLNTLFMPFEEHAFDITILAKKMKNSNHDISLQELQQKFFGIIGSGDLV